MSDTTKLRDILDISDEEGDQMEDKGGGTSRVGAPLKAEACQAVDSIGSRTGSGIRKGTKNSPPPSQNALDDDEYRFAFDRRRMSSAQDMGDHFGGDPTRMLQSNAEYDARRACLHARNPGVYSGMRDTYNMRNPDDDYDPCNPRMSYIEGRDSNPGYDAPRPGFPARSHRVHCGMPDMRETRNTTEDYDPCYPRMSYPGRPLAAAEYDVRRSGYNSGSQSSYPHTWGTSEDYDPCHPRMSYSATRRERGEMQGTEFTDRRARREMPNDPYARHIYTDYRLSEGRDYREDRMREPPRMVLQREGERHHDSTTHG